MAYKDLKKGEGGNNHDLDDDENPNIKAVEATSFVLIAILGIRDIIRPEVPDAV